MPQLNLLKPGDDPVGLQVVWIDRTPDGIGAFDVEVRMRRMDGDWTTLIAQRWTGVMLDFAPTFTTDVTTAWLWGERRDVLRAAVTSHRAAKAHARAHERE